MEKLLIGSHAIKFHLEQIGQNNFREPGDIDYAILENPTELSDSLKYPYDSVDGRLQRREYHSLPLLFEYKKDFTKFKNKYGEFLVAPLYILYALKLSHSFWDIHWEKTVHDILFFQENKIPLNDELTKRLIEYWKPIHKEKRVNLNKKTEEFFKDAVKREISHDELHELIKYGDAPWYSKLLKYPDRPLLDEEKFNSNPLKERLELAREEITVLAIERFILPKKIQNYTASYNSALKIVVTQLTKGWFPYFIMKNLKELYLPDEHYFKVIDKVKQYLRKKQQ